MEMADMQIPIEVVPKTNPPIFRWVQTVSTPIGNTVIEHEEALPPGVEDTIVKLIGLTRQLMFENVGLRATVETLSDQVAQHKAPQPAPVVAPGKGGRK